MTENNLKILLVDDHTELGRLVTTALVVTQPDVRVICVRNAGEAIAHLIEDSVDIALLVEADDNVGELESVRLLHTFQPDLPIIVLIGNDDGPGVEMVSLQEGVQDYLTRADVERNLLMRAVRRAIERARMQSTLRRLALIDDLTGLYNRRGFLALASHQLQLARRSERAFALIFGDLDELKSINDTLGHLHGSRAIEEMGAIFKESFRASDIVSRLGGDEFCALMVNATTRTADLAHARLVDRLRSRNAQPGIRFALSFSMGALFCDAREGRSLDELLAEVDYRMYQEKKARRAAVAVGRSIRPLRLVSEEPTGTS
jgi:two-component system cell cycle response regulator